MKKRRELYFELNSKISSLSNKELGRLLAKNKISEGWGSNYIVNEFGSTFFAKKIPLTKLESENMFCTKNIYGLPLYYNYGVGSAGFGAFRELNLHIKTTNWVLNGEIENFPLMYHYRIIPKEKNKTKINLKRHKDYVSYWNNSTAVDKYIRERKSAPYEIVVFLEFFPHTFNNWFSHNTEKVNFLSRDMFKIFDFLKKKGVIHFDAHFGNILSDGKKPYLCDFGLGLDLEFCHTKREKDFFKKHINYDYCEYIGCVANHLENAFHNLSNEKQVKLDTKYGIHKDMSYYERVDALLRNLDSSNKKELKLKTVYTSFLKRHEDTVLLMNKFFTEMRATKKKNIKFDHKTFLKHLKASKVVI